MMAHLTQAASQARELAEWRRQFEPHLGDYQRWRQEQTETLRQREAAEQGRPWYSKWWSPPEYDPSWERQIVRDMNGELRAAPGAPPDVVQRLLTYTNFRQQQAEKFLNNPFSYLEEPMRALIERESGRVAESMLRRHQEQLQARELVSPQASPWLYERGPDGRPALGPWGQRYASYVEEAERRGLRSPQEQHEFATLRVQNEQAAALLSDQTALERRLAQMRQTPANGAPAVEQARDRANEQFLQTAASRAPNRAGSLPAPAAPNGSAPANDSLPLAQRLLRDLEASGFRQGQVLEVGR